MPYRHRGLRPVLLASVLTICLLIYQDIIKELPSRHVERGNNFLWTGPGNQFTVPNLSSQFLAYLPHSGFHNQRIELENAIVLSIILNRTLVLPLARLGAHPLPYKPLDELLEKYSLSDKSRLSHCFTADTAANSTVKECRKFERYTHVSWQDIIDVSLLTDMGLNLVERWNFRQTWLRDTLQLSPSDIYWLKDSDAYEIQIYDNGNDETHQDKYIRRVNIPELRDATRSYPLLHFGTLFGSSRLRLSIRAHKALQDQVRNAMAFANPYLIGLSDDLVAALGGPDTYFSVHLRVGDGLFAENAVRNSHTMWKKLLSSAHGLSDEVIAGIQSQTIPIPPTSQSLFNPGYHNVALQAPDHRPCDVTGANTDSPSLSTNLFIATDARSPRKHPALQPFLSSHPCLYFISDFPQVKSELAQIVNPLDHTPMERFFLPFLDALVASRSATVIGTPESTFSKYIEDVLWPRFHSR
ncbi:hypothetical protein M408DRAFT_309739 [Serendipita vermifera MAFF 305830]|uniref:CigA protein n=1 Tax=Serendipita vermifera MAFF 305830 TaxID=933852 RepID=A0A0C3BMV9_SERVB|nr:hypothetical protein M408DRAFT_309739 [Serendipita vermifera MAFF 305830]